MYELSISEYELDSLRFTTEVIRGFMKVDPFFANMEFTFSNHNGPIRNVRGNNSLDQDMFSVHGEATISWDSIRDGNLEEYLSLLYSLFITQRNELFRHFLKGVSEITEATGMIVNGQGKPFSWDLVLDVWEKMEFGFDEDGNPLLPTLVVPPKMNEKMKSVDLTPEQTERKRRIIEENRARFDARKRTRKLS